MCVPPPRDYPFWIRPWSVVKKGHTRHGLQATSKASLEKGRLWQGPMLTDGCYWQRPRTRATNDPGVATRDVGGGEGVMEEGEHATVVHLSLIGVILQEFHTYLICASRTSSHPGSLHRHGDPEFQSRNAIIHQISPDFCLQPQHPCPPPTHTHTSASLPV